MMGSMGNKGAKIGRSCPGGDSSSAIQHVCFGGVMYC